MTRPEDWKLYREYRSRLMAQESASRAENKRLIADATPVNVVMTLRRGDLVYLRMLMGAGHNELMDPDEDAYDRLSAALGAYEI